MFICFYSNKHCPFVSLEYSYDPMLYTWKYDIRERKYKGTGNPQHCIRLQCCLSNIPRNGESCSLKAETSHRWKHSHTRSVSRELKANGIVRKVYACINTSLHVYSSAPTCACQHLFMHAHICACIYCTQVLAGVCVCTCQVSSYLRTHCGGPL